MRRRESLRKIAEKFESPKITKRILPWYDEKDVKLIVK